MNQSGESEFGFNASKVSGCIFTNSTVKCNDNLFGTEDDYIFDNPLLRLGFFLLYTLVFCLCFFGNLAVVLVVTLHWKMRSITKFCIGNLAFANFCVSVFCVYQNLTTFLMDRWIFGHFMCKMYHFINSLSHTASILILVVICVERYLAIMQPFKSRRWITMKRLKVVIITVWILSAVICSPKLYYIHTYTFPVQSHPDGPIIHEMICAPHQNLYDVHTSDMLYFVLLFLLPLLVISVLYAHIGIHLWHGIEVSRSYNCPSNQETTTTSTVLENNYQDTNSICSESSSNSAEETRECFCIKKSSNGANSYSFRRSPHLSIQSRTIHINEISNPPIIETSITEAPTSDKESSINSVPTKISESPKVIPSNNNKRRYSRPKSANIQSNRPRNLKSRRKHRETVIRMMIVIVGSFVICNLPFHLRKLCSNYLNSYDLGSNFSQLFTPLTFLFMYSNCAINPIIYAFMSRDFRLSLLDLFKCQLKRKLVRQNTTTIDRA